MLLYIWVGPLLVGQLKAHDTETHKHIFSSQIVSLSRFLKTTRVMHLPISSITADFLPAPAKKLWTYVFTTRFFKREWVGSLSILLPVYLSPYLPSHWPIQN